MSFLAPAMFFALPLALLPLAIHLLAQRRYETIQWAAMPFLLAAEQSPRGFAQLRQWLLLALRTAAVAALLLAAARPLLSNRYGVMLGQADAAIILLDRSPSMQQRVAGVSKLDAAVQRLATELDEGLASRWLLVESGAGVLREISGPEALADLPQTSGLAASAEIPAMLETAYQYVQQNQLGRTELWVVSDLRQNDWQPKSGRWSVLRESVASAPWQVRVTLLAADQLPEDNLAIRVDRVRSETRDQGQELSLGLSVQQEATTLGDPASTPREANVLLEVDGTRTSTTLSLSGGQARLEDYRIPLGSTQQRGWGSVTLPADANLADNRFYFVYDPAPTRRTTIVAEGPADADSLRIAAAIAPDAAAPAAADVYTPKQANVLPWESTALLIWQAPLPTGQPARDIEQFVARGGQVMFFPPRLPDDAELFGMRWGGWSAPDEPLAVQSWQAESGLLAPTDAGAALPVGQVRVRRICPFVGPAKTIAQLQEKRPLLGRVTTDGGGVYFWSTTARQADSNLAEQGITLYIAVQRAIEKGLDALAGARLLEAGVTPRNTADWRPLAAGDETESNRPLSTEYALAPGVYAAGDRRWAVNRPAAEDAAYTLARAEVLPLFGETDVRFVDQSTEQRGVLAVEAWRLFLVCMSCALLAEAILSLPPRVGQGRAA